MKKLFSIILSLVIALSLIGCTSGEGGTSQSEEKESQSVIDESIPDGVVETQIIADRYFSHGFTVSSQTDGIATPIGQVKFNEEDKVSPQWKLAQWYCGYYHRDDVELYDTYNILNGKHVVNGTKHIFTDTSKKFSIDTETGAISMRLLGTKEYVSNRQSGQPWPHILLEYQMVKTPRLKDLKSVRFEMDFELTRFSSGYTSDSQINKDLHTAQFVFYCTLVNNNSRSKDYGQYIWFGLNLFDARYEIIPAYASQDSGKEVNTGAFIYQPISSSYCKTPTRVGETQSIDYNILPRMRDAFRAAQEARFLTNTKWEDLVLNSGNFGFEVTGTYDIAADISVLNLYIGE